MALQPLDRPAGSSQVLQFRGTITAGEALDVFPKTNGTFTTGGAAGATRGIRLLLADATALTNLQRQLPKSVYDDEQPSALAPHTPVATPLVALVVNAGELSVGHGVPTSTDATWTQNCWIVVKGLSSNIGSIDTENAYIVNDTLTSGLGLNSGLPVVIIPVALLGGAVASFDLDVMIEVRWSAHR